MSLLERAWKYATAPEKIENTSGVIDQITGAVKSMISGTLGNAYNRTKETFGGIGSIITRTAKAVKRTISLNPFIFAGALAMAPINTTKAAIDTVGNIANGVGRAFNDAINGIILEPYDHLAMGTKNLAKTITGSTTASNSENKIAKAYGKASGTLIDLIGPSHLPTNLVRSTTESVKEGFNNA